MDTSHPSGDPEKSQGAQECAVGIVTFVKPEIPGFTCIVKQRYTDFLVNEILPNGKVLHLTELSPENKRKRADEGEAASQQKKLKSESTPDPAAKTESARCPATKTVPSSDTAAKAELSSDVGVKKEPSSDSTSAPIIAEPPSTSENQAKSEEAIASISDADKSTLFSIFGEDTTASIINLYDAVIARPDRKPRKHATVHSPPLAEKSKRTDAHLCVRRIFNSKLETQTLQDGDHQSGPGTIISVKAAPPRSPRNGGQQQQRGKENWTDLGGEYLHFTLYKENKDTMEVLYFFASQLKLHTKHFSFAGTKDRRGVTVQRIAVHRVRKERIEGLNALARGWRVGGPFVYEKNSLDLGMLGGNQFLLTLRDVRSSSEPASEINNRVEYIKSCAETAAQSLREHGFLNYFGTQRFGTHSTGTHAIGMKILQGDLKGAVDSILAYDPALVEVSQAEETGHGTTNAEVKNKNIPQDDIRRATAIHSFRKTGLSSEALSYLPGQRFSAEKGIITHLGKKDRKTGAQSNANDYQGALMMIQRNLRLMYVHAYQSFIWNTIAGKRWELFGAQVVEGDLVVTGEKERQEELANGTRVIVDEVDENGEPVIHPFASGDQPGMPATGDADDPFVRARPISREEAGSGRFTIFDVVLPLPGFDVIYPANELGKFYEDLMGSEQGGGLDPHHMRRTLKEFSLSGGYRKMMARPLGGCVEVEVRAYSDPEQQMVQTDLEKLEGQSGTNGYHHAGEGDGNGNITAEEKKIAVIVKLRLGSSQYATMALRELTKGGALGYTPAYSLTNR